MSWYRCAARQAFHRRSAVPEHLRRSRAGILCRRYRRRHHHRAFALQVAVRDRAQFELHLQGPSGRYQGSRAKARLSLCPRGVCAEGVGESPHHGAVDRCDYRRASMGDRFERDLTDVFALQDDIAVVSAIEPKMLQTPYGWRTAAGLLVSSITLHRLALPAPPHCARFR